jgi:ribA/ribD-fused uncharacterized protein
MDTIDSFTGKYEFLSNFYPSPILLGSVTIPDVEHGYQMFKTDVPGEMLIVLSASTPGGAKRAGRKVTMRPTWEEEKDGIMGLMVALKFRQHPELEKLLIETGDAELVEGNNWHDNYWGICLCEKCMLTSTGGQNKLGKILMRVRNIIKKQ